MESDDEFLDRIFAGTDFSIENELLEPLLPEINMISDQGIMSFVRSILLKVPLHFWQDPSSFSGKYHPPDERGEGGAVLHTKRVVRFAHTMAFAQEREQHEIDILISAALLHDITKGIRAYDEVQYDPMHPYTVNSFVKWARAEDRKYGTDSGSSALFIEEEDLHMILRLVRCHMGIWSPIPETVPVTTLEWILHLADKLASELHYMIDGDEVQDWRWRLP